MNDFTVFNLPHIVNVNFECFTTRWSRWLERSRLPRLRGVQFQQNHLLV